ncbi:MAG: DsbC family protein [Betaproteobacteria bacterium]
MLPRARAGNAQSRATPMLDAPLLYRQLSLEGRGFAMQPVAGPREPVIVLFDPQCRFCMRLWQNALPLAGRALFFWMPVAILNDKSALQGAAILAAADPRATMERHEAAFATGGLPVDGAVVDAGALESVRANTRILARGGGEAVPLTVFRDRATGQARAFSGALGTDDLRELLRIG